MATDNGSGLPVDFVQFIGKPTKGKVPQYLLATQVRKRWLERPDHAWRRQVKGAALTGNPERMVEVYRINDPRDFNKYAATIAELDGKEPYYNLPPFETQIQELTIHQGGVERQQFTRMPYLRGVPSSELAVKPYLLHTTIRLKSAVSRDDFSELNAKLLPLFAQYGLSLIVAGQNIDAPEKHPEILNVWYFDKVESLELLMMRLADNMDYFKLNLLGTQDQHIYRNISRHYQFSPLLSHPQPSSEVNV